MTARVPRPIKILPWPAAAVALAALVFAFFVDSHIDALVDGGPLERFVSLKWVAAVMRAPGKNWQLVAASAIALGIVHRDHWKPAALLAAADIAAGTVIGIMKGVFGRARPGTWPGTPQWVPLRGGWYGFWHQTNVGFASGDACQAFVWAETPVAGVPGAALARVHLGGRHGGATGGGGGALFKRRARRRAGRCRDSSAALSYPLTLCRAGAGCAGRVGSATCAFAPPGGAACHARP